MGNTTLHMVLVAGHQDFSSYKDVVVVKELNDTDLVYNLTKGTWYTRFNEELTPCDKDMLSTKEKENAKKFGLYQYA